MVIRRYRSFPIVRVTNDHKNAGNVISRKHPSIRALIGITCKLRVTKSSFSGLQISGCFSTAIFLKFRIFLIILVKQIYMVAMKVHRKWPLKLGNNCNPDTGDPIQ